MSRPRSLFAQSADDRFLSREACRAAADRVFAMATGGGSTRVNIDSRWAGNLRWARNAVSTGGDTQQSDFSVFRSVRGASGYAQTNALDDSMLRACVQRAEALRLFGPESPDDYPDPPPRTHPHGQPKIWFDGTVALDAAGRADSAEVLISPAEAAKLMSSGFTQVGAHGHAVLDTNGLFRYYPYTTAQYSVTVRDSRGLGSGWAGVDFNDWSRIDTKRLAGIALDKCVRSRNPSAVEPGRFTTIFEPQAVCDLVAPIVDRALDRVMAENGMGPFAAGNGDSKIGERVTDPRITLGADPMDPDCGFVPFDWSGEPYTKVNWIENGVLKELSYGRSYGLRELGKDTALPNSRSFRMSGGTATVEEMIASTRRGVLVTRLNSGPPLDMSSLLMTGNTRDGLWLIENGKISRPIKNFRYTESPLFALNSIEALGVPQRVYRPGAPAICPPMKVRDFSFTALTDAV